MIGEPVQHLRWVEGESDGWGDPAASWAEPVSLSAVVAPLSQSSTSSDESTAAGLGNRVITGLSLFLPPGAVVGVKDRFVVRGAIYEVDGEAFDWRSPFTGWNPGVQVALRRVAG